MAARPFETVSEFFGMRGSLLSLKKLSLGRMCSARTSKKFVFNFRLSKWKTIGFFNFVNDGVEKVLEAELTKVNQSAIFSTTDGKTLRLE